MSTIRAVVESLGGRLEVIAVFGEERIPLAVPTRTTTRDQDQEGQATDVAL